MWSGLMNYTCLVGRRKLESKSAFIFIWLYSLQIYSEDRNRDVIVDGSCFLFTSYFTFFMSDIWFVHSFLFPLQFKTSIYPISWYMHVYIKNINWIGRGGEKGNHDEMSSTSDWFEILSMGYVLEMNKECWLLTRGLAKAHSSLLYVFVL